VPSGDRPWAVSADGLVVTVRLTPKAGRDAIEGIDRLADGRSVLKARVRAAAHDGEANDALTRLLGRTLDVAPRDIALVAGAAARIKRLLIRGDARIIAAALEHIVGVVAE
jgi:uncharacterized protein